MTDDDRADEAFCRELAGSIPPEDREQVLLEMLFVAISFNTMEVVNDGETPLPAAA